MRGMSASTGRPLSGVDHLAQSLADILTTRIGTRVERMAYGSRLPERIDNPAGPALAIDLFADTAEAIDRWEPRFRLTRVIADQTVPGRCVLDLVGTYLPEGREITIDGIVIE